MINPKTLQKFEFYSIFLNNIILFLGVVFFGWTIFQTLFLLWLEPLAALLLRGYITGIVPLKYGPPRTWARASYQKELSTFLLLLLAGGVLEIGGIVAIVWQENSLLLESGIGSFVKGAAYLIYENELLFLSLFFLVIYLLPSFLLEKKGIKPSLDTLPLQAKIMLSQTGVFFTPLLLCSMSVLGSYFAYPLLILALGLVVKSFIEFFVAKRLLNFV